MYSFKTTKKGRFTALFWVFWAKNRKNQLVTNQMVGNQYVVYLLVVMSLLCVWQKSKANRTRKQKATPI